MAMALVTLQVVKRVPSSTLLWGAQVILMLHRNQYPVSPPGSLQEGLPRAHGLVQDRVPIDAILRGSDLGRRDLAGDALALGLCHGRCLLLAACCARLVVVSAVTQLTACDARQGQVAQSPRHASKKKKGSKERQETEQLHAGYMQRGALWGARAKSTAAQDAVVVASRSQRMPACLRAVPPNVRADRSNHFACKRMADTQQWTLINGNETMGLTKREM